MEQSGDSKRSRISWKNIYLVKTFLEACIQEVALNGREGGSLKGTSWKNVAEVLKKTHNFSVDRKQMKNHFDYLKGKYGAWLLLKNRTGNIYDPSTNTFNLTKEEWEVEMKKNRYIETLRTTPMPFPDLCEQLFDGTMSTGIKSWGPSSNEPCIPTFDPPIVVEDEGLENLNDTTRSVLPSSSQPPDKNKKQKYKQQADIVEERLLGVVDMIASQMNKHKAPKPTFQDCLSKLNSLGWPEYEPEYQVAVALFSDKNDNYRDCWMELKPDLCVNWVRMIGSSKGFMQ